MANKTLFASAPRGEMIRPTDTTNNAGGKAYELTAEQALSQLVCTGTFGSTFYASAEEQLSTVLELAAKCTDVFLAKLAVYSRQRAFMKDAPALLMAILSVRNGVLAERVFLQVIDNGKMLRNYAQIMRSGVVGRKSFGSRAKRMVQSWFSSRSSSSVFENSIGTNPSMADVIKMVHPKPQSDSHRSVFRKLLGKNLTSADFETLPDKIQAFEEFKKNGGTVPDVPFQMLTALPLSKDDWKLIAKNATWTQLRMNLNTFHRHGVFEDEALVNLAASRLIDRASIERAKALPYQLLMAYLAADSVPNKIRLALQDALEVSTSNVPEYDGKVYVFPDVSGSMRSPVTGAQGRTPASKVRCVDVAALIASTILRKNTDAEVLPFEKKVVPIQLNPYDSIVTNAQKLAAINGGGTACSAPLAELNRRKAKGDVIIYISDNESWADMNPDRKWSSLIYSGTAVVNEWRTFKARNPNAKMVCIDVQPNVKAQAYNDPSVLNIGGFSDQVFSVISNFLADRDGDYWVKLISGIEI